MINGRQMNELIHSHSFVQLFDFFKFKISQGIVKHRGKVAIKWLEIVAGRVTDHWGEKCVMIKQPVQLNQPQAVLPYVVEILNLL